MVRLTYRLDMTIAVDWDVKHQTKQTNTKVHTYFYIFTERIFQKKVDFEKNLQMSKSMDKIYYKDDFNISDY